MQPQANTEQAPDTAMANATAMAPIAANNVAPLPEPKPVPTQPQQHETAPATNIATAAAPLAAKNGCAQHAAKPVATPHHTPNQPQPMLPKEKQQALSHALAARMKDYAALGKTPQEAVAAMKQEYQALATALNPHGKLAQAATKILTQALNEQLSHAECHVPEHLQRYSIFSIFTKRQAEAREAAQSLDNPSFIQEATRLSQLAQIPSLPHWLTEEKKQEIVTGIGSTNAPHALANALGYHMQHKALAALFHLDGPLEAPLMQALHEAAPQMNIEEVRGIARNWLHDRFHRAETVAKLTKPATGELAIQAIQQAAKSVGAQYGTTPPTTPEMRSDITMPPSMGGAHHEQNLAQTQQAQAPLLSAPVIHQGVVQQATQVQSPPGAGL